MRCRTDGDGVGAERAVTARRARGALPPPTGSPSQQPPRTLPPQRHRAAAGVCAEGGAGGEHPPGDNDSVRAVGIAARCARVAT